MKNLNILLITLLTASMAGFASDEQKGTPQAPTLERALELPKLNDGPVLDLEPELELASVSFELDAPDRESIEFRASTILQDFSRSGTATIIPGSRVATPTSSPFRDRSPLFQAVMIKAQINYAGSSPEFAKNLLQVLKN